MRSCTVPATLPKYVHLLSSIETDPVTDRTLPRSSRDSRACSVPPCPCTIDPPAPPSPFTFPPNRSQNQPAPHPPNRSRLPAASHFVPYGTQAILHPLPPAHLGTPQCPRLRRAPPTPGPPYLDLQSPRDDSRARSDATRHDRDGEHQSGRSTRKGRLSSFAQEMKTACVFAVPHAHMHIIPLVLSHECQSSLVSITTCPEKQTRST